jgi:hypothetical protein
MTVSVPDELQPALDAATESESYEEMSAAIAAHFVPLSQDTYMRAVSFITLSVGTEGEIGEDGTIIWELNDAATLMLSPYALVPEGDWPNRLICTLLGYCYSQDIPFLGFGTWGNLLPEYAFKAKAPEKEARISAIFARAEANVGNPEILADCLDELAALGVPTPPPGSILAKWLGEMA